MEIKKDTFNRDVLEIKINGVKIDFGHESVEML